jgi:hypothetical protein
MESRAASEIDDVQVDDPTRAREMLATCMRLEVRVLDVLKG